jgi:secondary thiamine-phosphate synthase enzyme
MYNIQINTVSEIELIDITDKVRQAMAESDVRDGICLVFVPHTTAGITINENADPTVRQDLIKEINKIVPIQDRYAHTEGNSAAHIKASLVGSSVSIIVEDGGLKLGIWQGIYLCEFDGPRAREIWVTLVGN